MKAAPLRRFARAHCRHSERPFMRIVALLLVTLTAAAASAQEGAYLFDVLPKPAYRNAWEKLMKEVQPTPDWLAQFSRNYDGVAGPMKPATIEGKPYELYFVCKPHDCAAKRFEVMFEAGGKRAYGALGGGADAPYYYGAPPPALQEALAKALKG
jgi:hypothetical protein